MSRSTCLSRAGLALSPTIFERKLCVVHTTKQRAQRFIVFNFTTSTDTTTNRPMKRRMRMHIRGFSKWLIGHIFSLYVSTILFFLFFFLISSSFSFLLCVDSSHTQPSNQWAFVWDSVFAAVFATGRQIRIDPCTVAALREQIGAFLMTIAIHAGAQDVWRVG